MEGQKLWNNILTAFRAQVPGSTFKTWFSGSFALDYQKNQDKNLLIVAVPNNFIKEQVETRYQSTLENLAKKSGFSGVALAFVVSQKVKPKSVSSSEPIFSGLPLSVITQKMETLSPNHTFANFVVGPSNNLAYLAAQQVAANLGTSYNPLLFWGPTGVGKTHLAQAIGNDVMQKTIDAKILYMTCEKFTNDFLESLRNKNQASFRTKYRNVDLLLVDDVQFLAGKESTQDEFFYTFNELVLRGKQIVLICDRHPKELGRVKDRLLSRFLGGLACDIGPADFEMKVAILRAKCQEKNVSLDDEIFDWIAGESTGGTRELEGVLTSVLAAAKLSGKKLALSEIKNFIYTMRPKINRPTPERIIEVVCEYFGIKMEDVRGLSRRASLVWARQVLAYLLRVDLSLSLVAIGQIVGGRDHSTIIHAIDKVSLTIKTNQTKNDEVLRLRSIFGS